MRRAGAALGAARLASLHHTPAATCLILLEDATIHGTARGEPKLLVVLQLLEDAGTQRHIVASTRDICDEHCVEFPGSHRQGSRTCSADLRAVGG